jgi:hypothetical protein
MSASARLVRARESQFGSPSCSIRASARRSPQSPLGSAGHCVGDTEVRGGNCAHQDVSAALCERRRLLEHSYRFVISVQVGQARAETATRLSQGALIS